MLGETADSSNPENISKAGILTGFVYTDKAREVAPMSPEDRKKLLLADVAKRFGPKALEAEHYHESNWSTDQWTRGCFTGFLTPGATALLGAVDARAGRSDPLGRNRDLDALAELSSTARSRAANARRRRSGRLKQTSRSVV